MVKLSEFMSDDDTQCNMPKRKNRVYKVHAVMFDDEDSFGIIAAILFSRRRSR